MGYIYKITNNINQKVYIGQTSRTIDERWREHKKSVSCLKNKYPLYKAMAKYGVENFSVEEIENCADTKLDEREIYWIRQYSSFTEKGYNCTLGGKGSTMLTTYDQDLDVMIERYQQGERLDKICSEYCHNYLTVRREFLKRGVEIDTHAGPKKLSKKVFAIDPLTGEAVAEYPSISAASRAICPPEASARAIANHISRYKDTTTISHGFLWKTILD